MSRRLTYWKTLPLSGLHSYGLIPSTTVEEGGFVLTGDFDMVLAAVKDLGCMYELVEVPKPVVLEYDHLKGKYKRDMLSPEQIVALVNDG